MNLKKNRWTLPALSLLLAALLIVVTNAFDHGSARQVAFDQANSFHIASQP